MNTNFDPGRRPPKGPIAQLLAVIGGMLALAAALMFSLVFFAVLAVAGLSLWLYFWWTTRALRRQMREHAQSGAEASGAGAAAPSEPASGGATIEGEAVRVVDEIDRVDESKRPGD